MIQVPIDVYLGKHTGLDLVAGARGAGGVGGGCCSASDGWRSPAARGRW